MNVSDSPSSTAALTTRVRTYWNERIHDLEMTNQPVGTRAFFDELDDYRFDKLAYLPQVIDFGGYQGKRLVEVGCGVGTDLVRFARGGARVLGVDLSETAVTLARQNLAVHEQRVDECHPHRLSLGRCRNVRTTGLATICRDSGT